MRKIFLILAGVSLIPLGIAGIFLPILPGWVFIFLGLSWIAPHLTKKLKYRIVAKFSKRDVMPLSEWRRFGARAGFTTRRFPLVLKKTEELLDPSRQESLKKLFSEKVPGVLAAENRFVFPEQAHGSRVVILEEESADFENGFCRFTGADGVLTARRNVTLLVMTADCLPVFFCAVDKSEGKPRARWIGLVHAGWKGTRQRIAEKAFCALQKKSGCRHSDIHVAFGPRIGTAHYEVGPEFRDWFDSKSLRKRRDKLYFDLAGENRRQLLSAGAKKSNLADLEICTVSVNSCFYSFRKEKDAAGRTLSFITLAD